MVERSLSMREALGSMPRFSTFLNFFRKRRELHFLNRAGITRVVGLVVRISAFQADGPGSIPGRRT